MINKYVYVSVVRLRNVYVSVVRLRNVYVSVVRLCNVYVSVVRLCNVYVSVVRLCNVYVSVVSIHSVLAPLPTFLRRCYKTIGVCNIYCIIYGALSKVYIMSFVVVD